MILEILLNTTFSLSDFIFFSFWLNSQYLLVQKTNMIWMTAGKTSSSLLFSSFSWKKRKRINQIKQTRIIQFFEWSTTNFQKLKWWTLLLLLILDSTFGRDERFENKMTCPLYSNKKCFIFTVNCLFLILFVCDANNWFELMVGSLMALVLVTGTVCYTAPRSLGVCGLVRGSEDDSKLLDCKLGVRDDDADSDCFWRFCCCSLLV